MSTSYFHKGIILAGGTGSRLWPATRAVSKQLLPVYDKPMVYYPLSTLMLAGVRHILVIATPQDVGSFQRLLGDGSWLGLRIQYAVQPRPEGLAQALVIGREFIAQEHVLLILGDNLFYGHGFQELLAAAAARREGATVFACPVSNPEAYGVVELDGSGRPVSIVEKPREPRSDYAVTGLYFYDSQAVEIAARLTPSARGELEITDLNRVYLKQGQLHVEILDRGFAWLDMGTCQSLLEAANFVQTIEKRQGMKIGCVEEIALAMGFIDRDQFRKLAEGDGGNYGLYLKQLLQRYHGVRARDHRYSSPDP
ncbi:MAG TPA: glucose-1-phosphate thymidylyltransferase RfbA [Planctomycetaceae bacterium]|nr:glucose-1-phosphate thymidylyltransferase RfbA [Planctomycetaceae bacterium]HIQ20333.1 glucose-1-phosphate thymidylyltransferase [Planctomycetota bacterium]